MVINKSLLIVMFFVRLASFTEALFAEEGMTKISPSVNFLLNSPFVKSILESHAEKSDTPFALFTMYAKIMSSPDYDSFYKLYSTDFHESQNLVPIDPKHHEYDLKRHENKRRQFQDLVNPGFSIDKVIFSYIGRNVQIISDVTSPNSGGAILSSRNQELCINENGAWKISQVHDSILLVEDAPNIIFPSPLSTLAGNPLLESILNSPMPQRMYTPFDLFNAFLKACHGNNNKHLSSLFDEGKYDKFSEVLRNIPAKDFSINNISFSIHGKDKLTAQDVAINFDTATLNEAGTVTPMRSTLLCRYIENEWKIFACDITPISRPRAN